MKLLKTSISNYRNLNGVVVNFSERCNFIIGENNLGKSNFLQIFNIMFNSRGFSKDDFYDQSKAIEVEFTLKLEEAEVGLFDDLCDPTDKNKINLLCSQDTVDDNLEFSHKETDSKIRQSIFRSLNFIYYDSLRKPSQEINFDRSRGAGKFLSNLAKRNMAAIGINETEYINDFHINNLISNINISLSKIKAFKDFGITAQRPADVQGIVSRIIHLQDSGTGSFLDTGYGVQFMALITLNILDKIQQLLERKGDFVFTDSQNGNKYISIILGLDEPEIHLHPHAQRALIKYLNSIINNTNEDFKELLKDLFDLDGLMGQVILVTHSPNIILDDYREIIRFSRNGSIPTVVSGCKLGIADKQLKHVRMQHLNYKEAFFARGVFVVEGETEEGSIPVFFSKLGKELDNSGISIIKSNGGAYSTVKIVVDLFEHFKIPVVGIADKDDDEFPSVPPNIFITDNRDFEFEVVANLDQARETKLRNLILSVDGKKACVQVTKLEKLKSRFGITKTFSAQISLLETDTLIIEEKKLFYYCWLSNGKSIAKGRIVGEILDVSEIPKNYRAAIEEFVQRVD